MAPARHERRAIEECASRSGSIGTDRADSRYPECVREHPGNRSDGKTVPSAMLRTGRGQRRGRQFPMRPAVGCGKAAGVSETAIQCDIGNGDPKGTPQQARTSGGQAPRIDPLEWRPPVARHHQLLQCSPADSRYRAQLVERDFFAEMGVQPSLQALDSLQTIGRGSLGARLLDHEPGEPLCDFRLECFDVAEGTPGVSDFGCGEHPLVHGTDRRQSPCVDRNLDRLQ